MDPTERGPLSPRSMEVDSMELESSDRSQHQSDTAVAVGRTQELEDFVDQLYREYIGDNNERKVPESQNDELTKHMLGLPNSVIVSRRDPETVADESLEMDQEVETEEPPVSDNSSSVGRTQELDDFVEQLYTEFFGENISEGPKCFNDELDKAMLGKSRKSDSLTKPALTSRTRKTPTGSEKDLLLCPAEGCPKKYLLKRSLQSHIKVKHAQLYTSAKRTYVCISCSETFTAKTKLAAHRRLCSQILKRVEKNVQNVFVLKLGDAGWTLAPEL